MNVHTNFLNSLCNVLSGYIKDTNRFKKKKVEGIKQENLIKESVIMQPIDDSKISVKNNERDGYYLLLTSKRAALLQNALQNLENINVDGELINPKKLIFANLKGTAKITYDGMNEKSNDLSVLKNELVKIIIREYDQRLKYFSETYSGSMILFHKFASYVDFIKSGAKAALAYNYSKPEIVQEKCGFVECKNIRHPIIERIIDYTYVPHDISIGQNVKGMVVFGFNGGGKTSLMRAVGMSILMAQSGLFVPAQNYKLSPYNALYVRINANDNLFKNQSSYVLELSEINAILKRQNPYTFVCSDEPAKGTHNTAGCAILGALITSLANSNVSFFIATHYHDVTKLQLIKDLKNLNICHLSVEYNKEKDELLFDRSLKPGQGSEDYGILVARFVIHNSDFIMTAEKLKNELLNQQYQLMSNKTSRYNSNLYVDHCELCKKTLKMNDDGRGSLDSHHIIEQSTFTNGISSDAFHIKKNHVSNLVNLCKECHNNLHNGEQEITQKIKTSNGNKIVISKEKVKKVKIKEK